MAAAHCQGGSEKPNRQIADALGTPFPIRMESLAKTAVAAGFNIRVLWPWWFQMNPAEANKALGETGAQARG